MHSHKRFDVNNLVGSLPEKNFAYPHCSYFPLSSNINTRHSAACSVRFNVFFFWVGGSELISLGAQKAEGPLTPACWLSLHCLPAACCHGYLGSVAGQCSSSLMYDTASFTKQYCLCVAVISHLPGAFCSPLQPSPRSVGLPRTAWAEKRGRDRN